MTTKQQVIIVVGCDMTGKTQISQALASQLNVPYYKASSEHNTFLGNQKQFINDIRHACPARLDLLKQSLDQGVINGIVFDRAFPCEFVYSRFFNRQIDDHAVFWLDEQYAKLDAKIIVCYRKNYKGIVDDLDPNINEEALHKITSLYHNFIRLTECKTYLLCVDDEDLNREVSEVMKFIGENNE